MVKKTALQLAQALERYSRMNRSDAREALSEEWPRGIAALVDPILSGEPLVTRDRSTGPISIAEALSRGEHLHKS